MDCLGICNSGPRLCTHSGIEGKMNKAQETASRLAYGAVIGGFALLGLAMMAKEKVLDKIKKI